MGLSMYNNFIYKTLNKKESIKVAMISMHASPISELGGYKSGGMNLYIKEYVYKLYIVLAGGSFYYNDKIIRFLSTFFV